MGQTYCIFSAFYLPHLGGVEKYTQNLAAALIKQGNSVIIVTSHCPGYKSYETTDEGTIIRLPCRILLNNRFPFPRKNTEYKTLWSTLRKLPIDHVIINTRFYPHTLLGLKFAQEKSLTALLIDHGSAYLTAGNPLLDFFIRHYENSITSRGVKYHPRYFAVSQKGVQWLAHFNIKAEGILYNAIDANTFATSSSGRDFRSELNLSPHDFVIAFTGRLLTEKGVHLLEQAVRQLVSSGNDDIHLLIAGDGPEKCALERTADPHVHILGRLESPDIAALLATSTVFCFPTYYPEGFPTSLLEAGACGRGVITSDTGGAKELIPSPEYGIVIPDVEVSSIVEAIQEFYDNRDYRESAGKCLRQRILQEFSWEQTALRVVEACAIEYPAAGHPLSSTPDSANHSALTV